MELENTFTVPAGIDEAWAAFNDPRTVAPCFPGATLESYEDDSFTGTVKVKLGPISLTYKGKGTFVERDEAARKVVIEASGRDSRGNGTASATVTGTMHADSDTQTTVTMVTDMTVTGRPAQFGRGVMADVSDKIVGQFSSCLANKLGTKAESPVGESGTETGAQAAGAGAGGVPSGSAAAPVGAPSAAGAPGAEATAGETPPASVATATSAPASGGSASSNGSGPRLASAPEPTRSEVDAIDLLDTAGAPVLKRLAPVVVGLLLLLIIFRVIRGRGSAGGED
jgi:carbon monoxide dehydrogenase subunit G